MGWFDHIKSYVWDDRTTPYLVAVPKLSRPQADKELFSYSTFVVFVYGSGVVAALLQARLHENALYHLAALYCVSVVAAAFHLGLTKDPRGARYLVAAPVVAMAAYTTGAVNQNLQTVEILGLGAICLLWLRYTFRVVAIARAYRSMPARLPPTLPPPANPRQRR